MWASHIVLKPHEHPELPPSLPLPPPLYQSSPSPLLYPGSPSPHPQLTIFVVGSPWVCQSPSASWLEDPQTPPRPVDPAAPPWFLAPSSPLWPVSPPAPLSLWLCQAPPWSSVTLAPPRPSGSLPPPRSPEPSALP